MKPHLLTGTAAATVTALAGLAAPAAQAGTFTDAPCAGNVQIFRSGNTISANTSVNCPSTVLRGTTRRTIKLTLSHIPAYSYVAQTPRTVTSSFPVPPGPYTTWHTIGGGTGALNAVPGTYTACVDINTSDKLRRGCAEPFTVQK